MKTSSATREADILEAAAQAKASRRNAKDELFSLSELNWFSRNSYNLALKVCTDWEPHRTLRLVTACLKARSSFAIAPTVI